jgi:hypothetical protein
MGRRWVYRGALLAVERGASTLGLALVVATGLDEDKAVDYVVFLLLLVFVVLRKPA